MPLTAEQLTALDALLGADPDDLATVFHEKHGKAAQVLIDQGDTGATKRAGSETRKLEKRIAELTTDLTAAQKKLAESDPAKVHEQYQREIADLKTAHATELGTVKATGLERERERDLAELKARLAPKLRPMALRAVLNDPETRKQLEYGEDGTRRVLQRGKGTAYSPAAGQDVLDLWAADLVEHVKAEDADSVLAQVTTGGGSGDGGGSVGNLYDQIRTEETTQQEQGKSGAGTLAARLGMATPS